MRYKNLYDAAHAWVSEMVSLPLSVAQKLLRIDESDFAEVTPPTCGDRVYVLSCDEEGEVRRLAREPEHYIVLLDNGVFRSTSKGDLDVMHEDYFPMWGTMWSFSDPCDQRWGMEHMQEMADCGFRLYDSEDYGLVFGIDGAGYDFYREHWVPLYLARGLKWHEEAINV